MVVVVADGLEAASMAALAGMERLRYVVRGVLSVTDSDPEHIPLRALAAWYERMCVDPDYDSPPPEEGVSAFFELGSAGYPPPTPVQLSDAFRAINVARELGACRALWLSVPALACMEVALAKLDLATQACLQTLRGYAEDFIPARVVNGAWSEESHACSRGVGT